VAVLQPSIPVTQSVREARTAEAVGRRDLLFASSVSGSLFDALFDLPTRVRTLNRGQTNFEHQAAAMREHARYLAQHPDVEEPPGFDGDRLLAIVEGVYVAGTFRKDSPVGTFKQDQIFLTDADCEISVTHFGDGEPESGQFVRALVRALMVEGRDVIWSLVYAEPRAPLALPTHGGTVAQDFARSRALGVLSQVAMLNFEPEAADLIREFLQAVHEPLNQEIFHMGLQGLETIAAAFNADVGESSEQATTRHFPAARLIKTHSSAEGYAALTSRPSR
jgi:hypothetical protein